MSIHPSICSNCGKKISPEEDKYIITLKHRNKKVKHSWEWKAYTFKTLEQYHKRCYNLKKIWEE